MANEIRLTINVEHTNGVLKGPWPAGSKTIDQTEKEIFANVQVIGTSEEDIVISGITTLGLIGLRNLDGTNSIEVGLNIAGSMVGSMTFLPGEAAVLPSKPGVTWRAVASGAPCELEVRAWGR